MDLIDLTGKLIGMLSELISPWNITTSIYSKTTGNQERFYTTLRNESIQMASIRLPRIRP